MQSNQQSVISQQHLKQLITTICYINIVFNMTTTTSRIIIAQSQEPSGILGIPSKCTKFFVNRKYALEHSIGRTHSGQMHVELHQLYDAVEGKVRKNIVFLHGDFFTGDVSSL